MLREFASASPILGTCGIGVTTAPRPWDGWHKKRAPTKLAPLVTKPLEKRIAELEQNAVKFEGVWREGTLYAKQSLVTDRGGIWISLRETASRPPSGDWKLAVKSGAASEGKAKP